MSDEPTRDLDTRTPTVEEAALYWQWGGHMWQAPERFDRMIAKIRAEAWDEGVKAVRDWWETPDDEKYVIFNPYGTHPADKLLDDINANGDDDE